MMSMTISQGAMTRPQVDTPEPLFRSAHDALVFAFNFSMQQYDRPLMNRAMAGKPEREGKGLSGLDGAGQAGMIRAELDRLPPVPRAVLIASCAPNQLPCYCGVSCCAGWKHNPEWSDAMSLLTSMAAAGALSGCVSNGRLRSALIQRLLGAKATLASIAEDHDVSERTAEAQSAKLKRWLFGCTGKGGSVSVAGLHPEAYRVLTERLRAGGLIE